jgi:hypothetical protein
MLERADVRCGWEDVYFSFGGVLFLCIWNLMESFGFVTDVYLWSINTE